MADIEHTLKVNAAYEKIAFLPESEVIGRNLRELEEKRVLLRSVTLRVLVALKEGNTRKMHTVSEDYHRQSDCHRVPVFPGPKAE